MPLYPVPLPAAAWEKIGIDIVGPFDFAPRDSRLARSYFCHSHWHSDNHSILDSIFSREGKPKELVSDNGTQFTSTECEEFLKQREIAHLKASVYYPRANGEVERFNRVFKDCLQTASIQGTLWKSFIYSFLMDYRATPHATTGVSPSCLLRGRQMRTKLQILDVVPTLVDQSCVRKRVEHKQGKSKQHSDAKRSAKHQLFLPCDQVRVRKPRKVRKGEQKFTQPMTMVRQESPHTYWTIGGCGTRHTSLHCQSWALHLSGPKTMFWVRSSRDLYCCLNFCWLFTVISLYQRFLKS